MSEFLSQVAIKIDRASFGIADPVVGGQAKTANLLWVTEEAQLRERLHLSYVGF